MTEPNKSRQAHSEAVLLQVSILAFWIIALVVWWASLWHADTYADFGADLPAPTKIIIWSAQAGLPFFLAAVFSAAVIYQIRRSGNRAIVLAAWLLCATIACSSFAIFAMTSPMVKMCGEIVPGWRTAVEKERDSVGKETVASENAGDCVV